MNVLSLFDGMSCGQIALQRLGAKVDNYFASEIEKYPIAVTKANFPNTKHLGDVRLLNVDKLPKIDLLIGGSPCQSFSFAGKGKGMATTDEVEILTLKHYLKLRDEGYEFEGQSYLFWEYMRVLTALRLKNPNIKFLLENVQMPLKWEKILTKAIHVNPIYINSNLVSAQNRDRLYWTNLGMQPKGFFGDLESVIKPPKDKGILLKDILEEKVNKKYNISEKQMQRLMLGNLKTAGQISFATKGVEANKATALLARDYKGISGKQGFNVVVASRGRNVENSKSIKPSGKGNTQQNLEPRFDGKTNCLTSVQKDNLIFSGTLRTHNDGKGFRKIASGKGATIPARAREDGSGQNVVSINGNIRRLTPVECERLQTVPDNYTNHVSDTQRYKMLGNGWTVDVIVHILSYMDLNE